MLTDEEKAALVCALENGGLIQGPSVQIAAPERVPMWAFSKTDSPSGPSFYLNTPGQIVAELLKRESRIERAREKLREWLAISDGSYAHLTTDGNVWMATLVKPQRCGESEVSTNPLTAVIEASKRTPWPVEE